MAYGLVVPSASEIVLLQYMLNQTPADTPVLWLYKNDVTPNKDSVLADFTPVASSNIDLTPGSWTFTVVNGIGIAEYPTYVYTGLVPGTKIYGYYVTDNGATTLLWAQRCFFAPITITFVANSFSVTPRFNAQSIS